MIIHGDCLQVMSTLPDGSIDLTVTSPPYDNLRTYNGNSAFDFEGIAKELFRVMKDGGVVVWVVGDATINGSETGTSFRQALYFKEIGFNLHDTMIYQKQSQGSLGSSRAYTTAFEYMFCFSKGPPVTFNPITDRENKTFGRTISGTRRNAKGIPIPKSGNGRPVKQFGLRTNVWEISEGFRQHDHPAPFPIKLATDHVISWSNRGDTVLDPFAGSGTTGVACINTGRKFILIEKDAVYCDIIRKRIDSVQFPLIVDVGRTSPLHNVCIDV